MQDTGNEPTDRAKVRTDGRKLWCAKCRTFHDKTMFDKAKKQTKNSSGYQGWCRKAMAANIKAWKAEFKKRHGFAYA